MVLVIFVTPFFRGHFSTGAMAGLDRVPSRLPSEPELRSRQEEEEVVRNRRRQQQQQEEEAVSSIVEEVLASSPELAGEGARCRPPH